MIGQWLCGKGWHKFRFVRMYNVQPVYIPWYSTHYGTYVDKCARTWCGLLRVRHNIEIPKRVRT